MQHLCRVIALASLAAACGAPTPPQPAAPDPSAGLETRVASLESKVDAIAEANAQLTEAIQRLTALAEQLAAAPTIAAPPPSQVKWDGPDPRTTYAVPIAGSPHWGPEHAKVTIVMATEFACPYCEKVRPTLAAVRKRYGDAVSIVYKSFVVHPEQAGIAARAACAAARQNKFPAYYDLIFDELWLKSGAVSLTEANLIDLAGRAKLKRKLFVRDLQGDACRAKVAADQEDMTRVGVHGVPAFYVNGRFLSGAQPLDKFAALIDEELAKFEASLLSVDEYYEHLLMTGTRQP